MAILQYGILTQKQGEREDVPVVLLPEAYMAEGSENVQIRYDEIKGVKSKLAILARTPDTNPILKYHWFEKTDGLKYLFAFTKNHIYKWSTSGSIGSAEFTGSGLDDATSGGTDTGTTSRTYRVQIDAEGTPDTFKWSNDNGATWEASGVSIDSTAQALDDGITITFAATTGHTLNEYWDIVVTVNGTWGLHLDVSLTNTTEWSVATFNNKMIATNNQDKVLIGTDSSNFDVMGAAGGILIATGKYIIKAKAVAVFEKYLWLLNVTETDGVFPNRGRFCDIADETTWDSGDASYVDFTGSDHLTCAGVKPDGTSGYGDFLILFKSESRIKLWLSAGDLVFENYRLPGNIGCSAPDSVVVGKKGEIYFYANDKTIQEMNLGDVSKGKAKTLFAIPDDYVSGIQGFFIKEFSEIWWSVPGTPTSTENDITVTMTADYRWSELNFGFGAFGNYDPIQTNYTWNTLPFATWDEWAWDRWDSIESLTGFVMDIGADYSGYSFGSHYSFKNNSVAYTRKLVLACNLSRSEAEVNVYKRVLQMRLMFRKSGDTVAVYIKRDHEGAWQEVDTALLISGNEKIITTDVPCDFRTRHVQVKIESDNHFEFLGMYFNYVHGGTR